MRKGLLIFLVGGLLAMRADLALAQNATPAMGSPATVEDVAAPAADVQQMLVIGDALGGGLGAGLIRAAEVNGGFEVTNRFVEESGAARPEVYDWGATLPKILEGRSYDAIVVLLGANDRQMIKQGNLRFGFEVADWSKAYTQNLDRILEDLKASGAGVYWVSLPPMADPKYESAMQVIAGLQKARVEAYGMHYIDIRPAFLAADGSYTDTGPDDTGAVRKLRSRDGVTFFKQGNNRMAQLVMQAIAKVPAEAAPSEVKTSLPVDAPRPKIAIPAVDVPQFGQRAVDGSASLVKPVEVAAALVSATTASFALVQGSFADVLAITPPGSTAARLFTDGTSAKVPAGRLDDFAVPPQPK
jgi:hypothetical protein